MHTSLSTIISNKRRVSALKSLGIVTVEDALTYYPFRVTSPLRIANLKDVKIGEEVAFYAQVQSINVVHMNARRGFRIEINVLQDMQAVAQLIYFSKNRQYAQWLSAKMHVGEMVVVGGTSSAFNGKLQFTHPQILTVSAVEESDSLHQSRDTVRSVEDGLARMSAPMPVYHANSRISSEHIHETILSALSKDSEDFAASAASADSKDSATCTTESLQIPNITPESVLKKRNLMTRASAIYSIHNPQSVDEFYKAVDSLRYEEAFISQVAVLRSREDSKDNQAKSCNNSLIRNEFVESLPFELTAGQKDVIDEIVRDMRAVSYTHLTLPTICSV